MDELKRPDKIDYVVHEGMMTRQERHIKRLWILCIIIFAALAGTNAGWIIYESQFEDQVVQQDIDTGEGDAVVSGIGDIYGADKADSSGAQTENGR